MGCAPASSSDARSTTFSLPPQAGAATSTASTHTERFIGRSLDDGLEDGLNGTTERTDTPRARQRMRFPRRWAAAGGVALACALAPAPARAQLQLPAPVGYVNDFANVIDPAYRDSMQAVIDEVRAKSGGEIVVVTLPSLQGRNVDEVGLQIGREWKVGAKGEPGDPMRNTGTIVLVSMQDRKLKIETGERTLNFITAAEA